MVLSAADISYTEPLPADQQKEFEDVATPHYIVCTKKDATVEESTAWLKENRAQIDEALLKHGAILFRGFPFVAAPDFDAFVKSFEGYKDLPYEESLSFAVRLHVTGRVCTTNEGKKGGQVFHHEQAQTPFWPSKLFFYCERPADEGGATAVCPSGAVLKKLMEKYPAFVTTLRDKGIKYSALMAAEHDAVKGVGRSWKSFFGCKDRAEVEARMTKLGYTWEWIGEGETASLKATSPVLSGIRTAPGTKQEVFFNQLVAQVANAAEFAGNSDESVLDKYLTFGDGTSIPLEVLQFAKQECENHAVELVWQPGDVALLDNYLVMHARRGFEGKRRVLASLVK